MLVLTRAQLAQRVAEDQTRLARVEQRLRYIEMDDDMSLDMVIKRIPALRVAQVRYGGVSLAPQYDREWTGDGTPLMPLGSRDSRYTHLWSLD